MIKKTNIILVIGTFSILFLSIVAYFGIKYTIDKNFQENTIQCSNDTEKRRKSLEDNKIFIQENFYSRKLKTCIITWYNWKVDQGWPSYFRLISKELYTGRELNSFALCATEDECSLIKDYNADKIPELIWIKEDELRNICSSEDKNNPLKKYCSLVKNWNWRKEWKEATDSYR